MFRQKQTRRSEHDSTHSRPRSEHSNIGCAWLFHDDVIKWKHFPRYWPFVWRIHRSPVNFPHKGQWRAALMFFFICTWINSWINNAEAVDLRRHRAHCDVSVMSNSDPLHGTLYRATKFRTVMGFPNMSHLPLELFQAYQLIAGIFS